MQKFFQIVLLLGLLISCGGKEKELSDDVYEIRNIGELASSEYTIGKIIQLDDTGTDWYKLGKRKILISCKAKVKAGVDLTQIKKGDIRVKGSSIEITLPPAKITSFTMDPKDIRTEMEGVSGLRDPFTQQEKNDFLKQGEEAIREELEQTGLLKDAERNAITFIEDFYKQMGYKKIDVHPTKSE